MPRAPRVLTDKELAQVEALAPYLTAEQIADHMGMGRRTLYDIMDRDEAVAARYKKGKAKAIALVGQSLVQKALNGDGPAGMFYLKTQAGWKETLHVDNTSSDGSMSPKADQGALDAINSRLDSLAAAKREG